MLTKADIDQLLHLIRPIALRIANTAARATVQLVDDSGAVQMLQIGALANETPPEAEHFEPYGFTSVPLVGAQGVVVYPNGDQSHPLVIVMGDRRSRPTGGAAGDVKVYNAAGACITLLASGNIEVHPAPGGSVIVSGGGTTDSLVTKAEFNAHTHPTAGTGAPSQPTIPAVGTTVLKAQ